MVCGDKGMAANTSGTRIVTGLTSPLDRYDVLGLVILFVAALAVRLYGLGSESIWLDEATSVVLAKMSIPGLIEWTAVDIHPPLYYMLLHFWLALGDGEVQVRLLSVVFGTCSVGVLYLLCRRLFNRWLAFSAALLLVASPLHVWYSQETRMYALLTLLALLMAYFMARALLDRKRWAWVAYLVCAIAALYTHYYAFFVLLFLNVVALYLLWRGLIDGRAFWRWVALQTVAGVAFLPWLPTMLDQIRAGGGSWVGRNGAPGLRALGTAATSFTVGPDSQWYMPWLRRLAYAAFGFLCVVGVLSPLRRRQTSTGVAFALIYLLVPILTAWLISQVKPLYSVRYLLPFLPAYYILIGQGLDMLRPAGGGVKTVRSALWALALAGLLLLSSIGILGSATHQQQADWRGIAAHVLDQSQPGDVVVFVPGWNVKPFDFYARGRIAEVSDTPIPINSADIRSLIAGATRGRTRLWYIQTKGHYSDPENDVGTYLDATFQRLEQQRSRENIVVSLYRLAP